MNESTAQGLVVPAMTSQDVLTEILLDGAQRLLGQAIEAEVDGWLESHKHRVDENGHRQVVGNGRLPTRSIVTGVGPVAVSQRRVHDRRSVGTNDDGEPIDADGQVPVAGRGAAEREGARLRRHGKGDIGEGEVRQVGGQGDALKERFSQGRQVDPRNRPREHEFAGHSSAHVNGDAAQAYRAGKDPLRTTGFAVEGRINGDA